MPFNQNTANIIKKNVKELIAATNMSTLNDVINGIMDLLDDDSLYF